MLSILVTMDEARSNGQYRHIQPTAAVQSLSELPALIQQL
jgi:hypothetical protein